jgi:hypothetical protein
MLIPMKMSYPPYFIMLLVQSSLLSHIKVIHNTLKFFVIPKFNICFSPGDGIVGIKFDDISGGKMLPWIFNMQGQTMVSKEILWERSSFCQIATLQRGI